MFKEEDFEEVKDWLIRTDDKQYYVLPSKTKNELYNILVNKGVRFLEVLTWPDKDRVIIPLSSVNLIRVDEQPNKGEKKGDE